MFILRPCADRDHAQIESRCELILKNEFLNFLLYFKTFIVVVGYGGCLGGMAYTTNFSHWGGRGGG